MEGEKKKKLLSDTFSWHFISFWRRTSSTSFWICWFISTGLVGPVAIALVCACKHFTNISAMFSLKHFYIHTNRVKEKPNRIFFTRKIFSIKIRQSPWMIKYARKNSKKNSIPKMFICYIYIHNITLFPSKFPVYLWSIRAYC